jgi:hypothetical protein
MAAVPVEIDPNTIVYTDADGNVIKNGNSGSSSSSGSVWGSIIGAIPGILSSLFPQGVKGNNNNNYPYVQTLPNGNTSVNLAGNNNSILMIALLAMVAYLIFTGKQPIRAKR